MRERDLELLVISALRDGLPDTVDVLARVPLMYATAIQRSFEVDILVREARDETPRVVIELKVNPIHSDALIVYGSKANLHRTAFPSLRYGLLAVGTTRAGITPKWLWHGGSFDFMLSWSELDRLERSRLVKIVSSEIATSRRIDRVAIAKGGSRPTEIWRKTTMRGIR